jgi:hypothetical protein
MGHCCEFDYVLWATVACTMDHCGKFGYSLWVTVGNKVINTVKICDNFCAMCLSAKFCSVLLAITIGGHRHRSQCRRYPTSDINICYSDIGEKYVGLTNVIPISEVFRYRHQSSFRYPTLKKKIYFTLQNCTLVPWNGQRSL